MAEIELERVRDISPTRFRDKKDANPTSTRRHIENKALLLVNDAIHLATDEYYVDEIDGQVKTVWQAGDFAREVALWMRGDSITNLMSCLATFDLLLCALQAPVTGPQMDTVVKVVHYLIWSMFLIHLTVRFKFMASAMNDWFKGAEGPPWDCCHAFVIMLVVPIIAAADIGSSSVAYRQFDGETSPPPHPTSAPRARAPCPRSPC